MVQPPPPRAGNTSSEEHLEVVLVPTATPNSGSQLAGIQYEVDEATSHLRLARGLVHQSILVQFDDPHI